MAKRDRLNLGGGMTIETGPDWRSRYWIGYRKGCSMFFRDVKTLRKWLGLPPGTTSRQAFDSWVASIEAMDAERKGAKAEPVGDANVEGSFDPLAHGQDESDPNHSCKVII